MLQKHSTSDYLPQDNQTKKPPHYVKAIKEKKYAILNNIVTTSPHTISAY